MAWTRRTGFGPVTRAGRILEGLPVDMQGRFKLIRHESETEDGVEKLLAHLSVLNGERPGDRERAAHNAA
eukprot:3622357-Pyramimonas_sp.AAC.1